jgi:hypothetical protein
MNHTTKKQKFTKTLRKYSSPHIVQKKAYKYLSKTAKIYPSSKREKKYQIYDPLLKKWVHFGQIGYEDFTKHKNNNRRKNYLARSTKIKGNWKKKKYSPNNLSIHILW